MVVLFVAQQGLLGSDVGCPIGASGRRCWLPNLGEGGKSEVPF